MGFLNKKEEIRRAIAEASGLTDFLIQLNIVQINVRIIYIYYNYTIIFKCAGSQPDFPPNRSPFLVVAMPFMRMLRAHTSCRF